MVPFLFPCIFKDNLTSNVITAINPIADVSGCTISHRSFGFGGMYVVVTLVAVGCVHTTFINNVRALAYEVKRHCKDTSMPPSAFMFSID